MTYSVKFSVDSFSSTLAWTTERFTVSGSRKVRVKELPEERFVGACDERRWYVARSSQPFVVTVSRRAGGQNGHLNGDLVIYVASRDPGTRDHRVEVQYAAYTQPPNLL